jgi:hypothetical protein
MLLRHEKASARAAGEAFAFMPSKHHCVLTVAFWDCELFETAMPTMAIAAPIPSSTQTGVLNIWAWAMPAGLAGANGAAAPLVSLAAIALETDKAMTMAATTATRIFFAPS